MARINAAAIAAWLFSCSPLHAGEAGLHQPGTQPGASCHALKRSGSSAGTVVLVHGIYDTSRKMQPLAAALRKRGFRTFTPTLAPSDGSVGLDELAEQLRASIDQEIGRSTRFSLVGFSMGGVIARYYVQRLGGIKRVSHFITISAPNHGTAMAWLNGTPGARQMRLGSSFLRGLNADAGMLAATRFSSIWTPLDLMIIPSNSSRMPVGQNIPIFSLAHPLMVYQPSSLALVARLLAE